MNADTSQPSHALPPALALELSALVSYQAGAVVSRTLVKQNTCTLTAFAFDAGQALSEHTAPFDAIVQILEGTVDLVIGGKPVSAQAGQIVLMPANVPHALTAATKLKFLLLMARGTTG
jgi:quercetin dioxygenase-like cupin family protein